VPRGLSVLTNLSFLDLSDNDFVHVDLDFSGMTNLTTLRIRDDLRMIDGSNSVDVVLSDSITALRSLTSLDFHRTDLLRLPATIGDLQCLQHLCISACDLRELPPSITRCTNLVCLEAGENMFSVLPENIGDLQALEYMDFYQSDFVTIPASVCTLSRLKSLWLDSQNYPPGFDAFIASTGCSHNE